MAKMTTRAGEEIKKGLKYWVRIAGFAKTGNRLGDRVQVRVEELIPEKDLVRVVTVTPGVYGEEFLISPSAFMTFTVPFRESPPSPGRAKIAKVMREFKAGTLKSGSGRVVKSRRQAMAIALSEARRAGARIPKE